MFFTDPFIDLGWGWTSVDDTVDGRNPAPPRASRNPPGRSPTPPTPPHVIKSGPALATAFMGIHCPSRRWASLFFKGRGAARVEPAPPPPVALFCWPAGHFLIAQPFTPLKVNNTPAGLVQDFFHQPYLLLDVRCCSTCLKVVQSCGELLNVVESCCSTFLNVVQSC